jgi:nucleobase transporter 1/2
VKFGTFEKRFDKTLIELQICCFVVSVWVWSCREMAGEDSNKAPRPGPWPPAPDSAALPPSSWAKRTGFRPKFSGETNASDSGQIALQPKPKENDIQLDLESGRVRPAAVVNGTNETVKKRKDSDAGPASRTAALPVVNGQATTAVAPPPTTRPIRRPVKHDDVVDVGPQSVVDDDGFTARATHMKYELRDTPGLVPLGLYGFQHYLSMLGSLVLIPLVIVPAMGGTYEDTSAVVSTALFVSGMTTLLHSFFGSRLPLIQGQSFVFLAPALAIINSPEFLGLNGNNFKHIMKELQGAIIIASAFQTILGYSGLMSILLRLINPVVVSPTIAAMGLSFYSYGFPQAGSCLEIGAIQILLVIIFSLYLRKVSLFGHRIFLIYAVPLGLAITWATAFLLTEAGTYSYKGCDPNVPASNIISDHCRKHVSQIKNCRVDTSHALRSSPWFRFPYPLQWGTPVFHWKMAFVMCAVSIISSVDSVGSYHASSLLVASRPPTAGVVSRGIGIEGLSSLLAGLWGTGTGSTTLTENVHTIAVTKIGSRRSVQFGACLLVILSLIGKVGGFIASIPQVMVAALLCFMWAMLTALGLSNLRYSEAGSSRNVIIVGLSLFFSLSIPAYFQQYNISPNSNVSVPAYFMPYIVASHGPFHTKFGGLNYVMNTLLSLHMVIAFLVAVILDNTVPGGKQERGVYVWSDPETARREPAVTKDYELPFRVGRLFRWVKWVGL